MIRELPGQLDPDEGLLHRLALHHRANRLDSGGELFESRDDDLSRLDLAGVDLSGAAFLRVIFDRSNLRRADLSRAEIARSSMRDVDLSLADLYKAELDSTILTNASLVNARLDGMKADGVDLRGADLSRSTAYHLHCADSDLRGAILRDIRFHCTTFRDCKMKDAEVAGSCGTLARRSRIDVGDEGTPVVVEGEVLLAWFRDHGATVTWFDRDRELSTDGDQS